MMAAIPNVYELEPAGNEDYHVKLNGPAMALLAKALGRIDRAKGRELRRAQIECERLREGRGENDGKSDGEDNGRKCDENTSCTVAEKETESRQGKGRNQRGGGYLGRKEKEKERRAA